MVQIYENKRQSTGERLSQGLSRGLEMGSQIVQQRQQKQKEMEAYKKMGIDPSIANLPDQFKQQFVREAIANKNANNSENVDYNNTNQQVQQQPRENINDFMNENKFQRQELPEFRGQNRQPQQGLQSNRETEETINDEGNLLNPSRKGGRIKVLSFDEVMKEGKRIAKEQTANNQPTSVLEGVQIAENLNNMRKNANIELENEVAQKISQQEAYGNKGVDKLTNVFPDANDEEKALFKRKGEEYASKNKSEAEIDKLLSKDARMFKNTLNSIKNGVGPRRLWSNLEGNTRDAEKTRNDINIKLQPLLKEGLYDTARSLLAKNGFYKEEIENIITKLNEGTLKTLAQFNKIDRPSKSTSLGIYDELSDEQKQMAKNNMLEVFKNDPSTNLMTNGAPPTSSIKSSILSGILHSLKSIDPSKGVLTYLKIIIFSFS